MSREDVQREAKPQIVADVCMYETAAGGRLGAAPPGWGCLACASPAGPLNGWDALPLLRDKPLHPGESRRLGFVFLAGVEAAGDLKRSGRFYLWEGSFIGEATVDD